MRTFGRQTGWSSRSDAGMSGSRFDGQEMSLADSADELMAAFNSLLNEGKAFLKATAGVSGSAVEDARTTFAAQLDEARAYWGGWSQTARARGRRVAIATDDYVHAKPWLAIGMAAGAAFVIAALATRR